MIYDPNIHHRRSIRLKNYDYSRPGQYYVTICELNKKCLFSEIVNGKMLLNDFGQIVNDQWLQLTEVDPAIRLAEYVVMPNHFHGIITFAYPLKTNRDVGAIHESPDPSTRQYQAPSTSRPMTIKERRAMGLPKVIGRFKTLSSKQINQLRGSPGVSVWQRDYYEHIIRDRADYEHIANYILKNPTNWRDDSLHPDYDGNGGSDS